MPRGDKSTHTDKQKGQAQQIEQGREKRDVPIKETERRAWATGNEATRGAKKSGSAPGRTENREPEHKSNRVGGRAESHAERSRAARKGWETRRQGG